MVKTHMTRRFLILLAVVVALTGCGEYNKVLKSSDYNLKYDFAKKAFERKKYVQAYTLLGDLVPIFKGTEKGEEIVNGAIEQKFIESKELTEPQFELLNRIAESKINKNLEVIEKREFFARPVLYQREKSDDLINKEISESNFLDLKSNVIDVGACVLCGACEYACPDNLITIDDTKPRMKGDCPEDCHACFAVCPRTFIPENLRNDNSKALGDFIKVLSVKSVRHTQGQDGSIVTTILDYLLTNDIVTDALIVDKEDLLAWKPYAKITNDIDEVIKSGGTKYSVCPVFKPLRDIKEEGK